MKKLAIYYCLLTFLFFSERLNAQGAQITQGGTAYAITSPYAAADLFEIQYIQSADIMYLVHPDYHPQILSHYGETNWTIADVNLVRGPFMAENDSVGRTLTPSGTTGSIYLTAAYDTFYAGHVGAQWQLVHPVDANIVEGRVPRAGTNYSDTLAVQVNRDYTAKITDNDQIYSGTMILQRSYDDGTSWRDIYNMEPGGADITYMNTETINDAIYRIKFVDMLYGYFNVSYENLPRYSLTAHAFEQEGIVEITGVEHSKLATATVLFDLGDTSATYKWSEGSFSDYRGFPAAVAIFHERLVFGGTKSEPQTLWFSQTNDWHNFLKNDLDRSSMTLIIAADQINKVRWLSSHSDLIIGTAGDEWKLYTANDKSISPTNLPAIKRQSTNGSAKIQPLNINNRVIYTQRNSKKILRTGYQIDTNAWMSENMTLLSEHITGEGITELAYQRTPYQILWAVCTSGDLLCCVLEDNQEVLGWSRYVFDGDCESVAVKPGDTEDEVWIIVKRTIDGSEVLYIEQFMPFDWGPNDDDAFFVDCGLSWDGGSAVDITVITQADPISVTAPEHSFSDGDQVRFSDVGGMTELNNKVFTVHTVSGSSFVMRDRTDSVDISSEGFTEYTSGGTVIKVENAFSGLDHLEGQTVVAAGDAGYAGSYTVSSGAVTLGGYYNRVHIGLPFTSKMKPMKLDFLATGGRLQGLTKRITAATLRVDETLGGSIGPDWMNYASPIYRLYDDDLEAATPFFSGDKRVLFPGRWDTSGDICVQHSMPLPFTLLSLIVEFEAHE